MNEPRAQFGAVKVLGASADLDPPGRMQIRTLLRSTASLSIADFVAAGGGSVLSFFAPPGAELDVASSAITSRGEQRAFTISKDNVEVLARVRERGVVVGHVWVRVDFGRRRTTLLQLYAAPEVIGKRFGRRVLANMQRVHDSIDLRSIDLYAAGSHGAVVWARAGFDVVGADQRQGIEDDLAEVLEVLPFAPFTELPAQWRMRDIANMMATDGVDRSIREVSEMVLEMGGPGRELEGSPLDTTHGVDFDRQRPLGEVLAFLVAPWMGVLDLQDPATRATYEAFLVS